MPQIEGYADYLPPEIVALIRTRVSAEFAMVSAAGVPIDTPSFVFPDDALTTLDIGTGVAYPAKAERSRRNPKVGMLVEGGPDEPVVSIAGLAAVHDASIQSNLERYLAETIFAPNVDPNVVPWEQTRRRFYYLSRIIVAVAVPAKPSASPAWPQKTWQDLADQALGGGMPAHLTLVDGEGFPLPLRVRSCRRCPGGFELLAPRGAPWSGGKATLSFVGKEIFVGEAAREGKITAFYVERALPVLPMVDDREGMKPEVLAKLDARLAEELARQGQAVPVVPDVPPASTRGALLRAASSKAIDAKSVGTGISR